MRAFAKVLALGFLIFFAVIFIGKAKTPQQETTTNKAGEAQIGRAHV